MKEQKQKVLFDPGYCPIVINSLGQIGYSYYMFSAIQDIKIKRINFPNLYKKMEKLLLENVSFYLGCLLWANCIARIEDGIIEGNQLLHEDAKEEEYTSEINFLISFLEKDFPRDCKYYLNKKLELDNRYLEILKTYKEFLIINQGFVYCENTNQIKIPKNLKEFSNDDSKKVNEAIMTAIQNKDLSTLFEVYDLLF